MKTINQEGFAFDSYDKAEGGLHGFKVEWLHPLKVFRGISQQLPYNTSPRPLHLHN